MTSPAIDQPAPEPRATLRLVPAPQPAGTYDDEVPSPRRPVDGAALRLPLQTRVRNGVQTGVQGTLALAFPMPSGVPAVPTPSPRLRVVGRVLAHRAGSLGAVADATADRPDASRWVALIAQAIVEAEVGDRPVAQLARWTTEDVYVAIAKRCTTHARQDAGTRRTMQRAVVSSIHVCPIDDDVVEACAIVRWAARARAVALRLEGVGCTWRCTAVSLG